VNFSIESISSSSRFCAVSVKSVAKKQTFFRTKNRAKRKIPSAFQFASRYADFFFEFAPRAVSGFSFFQRTGGNFQKIFSGG
jgi:hypothetical protein